MGSLRGIEDMKDLERIKNIMLEQFEDLSVDDKMSIVSEVNGYNGRLEWLDYYENSDYFFQDMFGNKVDGAVRAVCYGNYNYMDEYVKFNAYGNLESANEWELEKEYNDYKEEIIEAVIELHEDNHNIDYILEKFDFDGFEFKEEV